MSSEDYLVTSDEHIRLQGEIIFRGEYIAETILSLAVNTFIFYLEVGLETSQKKHKLEEKVSEKNYFKFGMDLQKGQKQSRVEKTQ